MIEHFVEVQCGRRALVLQRARAETAGECGLGLGLSKTVHRSSSPP